MAEAGKSWASALLAALSDSGSGPESLRLATQVMDCVANLLRDPVGAAFFSDPSIARAEKIRILDAALAGIGIAAPADRIFHGFFVLAGRKGRLNALPSMALHFRRAVESRLRSGRLRISSAQHLSPSILADLSNAWKEEQGLTELELETVVKPELIGGFVLEDGSIRQDWSYSGCLERMAKSLAGPLPKTGRGEERA